LVEHLDTLGIQATDVAVRFAVDHPFFASTLVGMKSVDEVRQNLAAVERPVDPELMATIDEFVAPVRNVNWIQGIPEYSDPGSVSATTLP
jgi:aryl-alcohol dehydrogenase-like predicted oxidoreductase